MAYHSSVQLLIALQEILGDDDAANVHTAIESYVEAMIEEAIDNMKDKLSDQRLDLEEKIRNSRNEGY